jgi:uncharacterized protein YjbI with pentapeptide repeats/beta-lactamase regulating signal transducer with metallopeptidase domain
MPTDWYQTFVTFASALVAIVLNALWQDALLVLCVWLLLRVWPRINAATRYTVWSTTLVAALVVPVGTTLAFFTPAGTLSMNASQTMLRAPGPSIRALRHETAALSARPSAPLPRAPERVRVTLSAALAITMFTLWLLLAAYALVRLVIGLLRLEQLKRDALPLSVEYRDAMPQWLRANKGARDVRLCVSDETDVPVAVGLFDAMILIPRLLLERLSEPEVDQICLHELAHLRRADDWTNGLQRVISALLGWNPAVQFVGQQLDLEREVACDDWVLSFVGTVRPYALCLTKLAENASWPRRPIPAPGVFATRKHISLRIERLLGAGRNIATNLAPAPAAAAVAVVAAIALVIAVVAPSVAAAPIVTQAAEPITPAAAATAKNVTPTRHAAPAEAEARVIRVATMGTPMPATASSARPKVHVEVPALDLKVPPVNVEVPATNVEVPATKVEVPATKVEVPATKVEVPTTRVEMPKTKFDVPGFDAKQLANTITRSVTTELMRGLRGTSIAQGNSCVGCDYSGVNWAGRDLHGQSYTGSDFSRANLAGVNFSGGSFNGADFSRANLAGASFRNAHLTGCDFSNANLEGTDFTGARMSGCEFTRARLRASQLRDVLDGCKGCDFSHADLVGLDLHGVRTNGDDFSDADLRNVNFANADLVGADFSNAKLDGANLAGATLNGCDLSGVDLSRVDLSKTKLIGTDLPNQ